jgi:hypothetical protein
MFGGNAVFFLPIREFQRKKIINFETKIIFIFITEALIENYGVIFHLIPKIFDFL